MTSKRPTSSPPPSDSDAFRSGYVALVGRPNAGKSTLFNACLGQRLSIVTPKPQTTRGRILGILTRPSSQVIILDTPGLLEPEYRLHETMEHQIEQAARQADLTLLLIDAGRPDDRADLVRRFLQQAPGPVIAALNKIDLLPPERVAVVLDSVRTAFDLQELVTLSALRGDGVVPLLDLLESRLPPGPRLYPEEMVAEQPERFFVAEFVRQAAFEQLEDEVPYAVTVMIEEFRERPGRTYIGATLYVERDSQKGIVIGRGGSRLRAIGTRARQEIEQFLDVPVYLELWVKVRPDWRRKERDLKEFGYG
ncbi:MAG: GTPase Era [Candidatus Latescibacterota bacterium]